MSFVAISTAYPTPNFRTERTSLVKHDGLDFDLTRYLNARAPDDISQPPKFKGPDDPDDPDEPNYFD
ncbi:uncharacterized protein EDB93DRAFT_1250382 [Suillus bovinus]|uniref:uncharacterized protein n=1 Tax=Suillus bovinus TaxID=48563 RepID=UPI001B85B836|nr:uncharacterized protein EDB93DRAFT_1250382 [Suillus bovinus]KAG2147876.1 hypothetical protein EDB93DRAFT_1250382 [Suillus bovinus]